MNVHEHADFYGLAIHLRSIRPPRTMCNRILPAEVQVDDPAQATCQHCIKIAVQRPYLLDTRTPIQVAA